MAFSARFSAVRVGEKGLIGRATVTTEKQQQSKNPQFSVMAKSVFIVTNISED